MARVVHVIPATVRQVTSGREESRPARRVAGYARVSTEQEEQESSYEAQISYYTRYINSRPDWELVGIYADDGKSGTSTRYRKGFQRMVDDAMVGKIDLIITKSISRFARNTVDSLVTVRKLRERNVEVYFEKEGFGTFDSKAELVLTIFSSLAQEESRNISENTTWGHRKRFADGKGSVAYSSFLGYDKGEDGKMVVNEKEAEVVRFIYRSYLAGWTTGDICRELMRQGVKSPMGKDIWRINNINSILSNEKYKGDMLLQKEITVNYLTKQVKKNEGEVPQYYIEDDHEAIIDRHTFDMVQEEKRRRSRAHRQTLFTGKVKCGKCGAWYGRKVWHSNEPRLRKYVYRCNEKYKSKCGSPVVTEEQLKDAVVRAVARVCKDKKEILAAIDTSIDAICDTRELVARRAELIPILGRLVEAADRGSGSLREYKKAQAEYDDVQRRIDERNAKRATLEGYRRTLAAAKEIVTEFDETLFFGLVDYLAVYGQDDIRVTFLDGREI